VPLVPNILEVFKLFKLVNFELQPLFVLEDLVVLFLKRLLLFRLGLHLLDQLLVLEHHLLVRFRLLGRGHHF
jgi:hypothetical protein